MAGQIRLYQNADLTNPRGADIIFTAQSGSTPPWIESQTTFDEAYVYFGAVSLQTIFVSNFGNDSRGNGTQSQPFATRAAALAAIGSSATSTTPYAIVYDTGNYTFSTFQLQPWVYETCLVSGGATITVSSGNITLNTSLFTNVIGRVVLQNLSFVGTGISVTTSGAGTANLTLNMASLNVTGATSITGTNTSTVTVNLRNNGFAATTFTDVGNIKSNGGESYSGLTVISSAVNSTLSSFNDNVFGALQLTNSTHNLTANLSGGGKPSSITLTNNSTGTLTLNMDTSSYVLPTTSAGTPVINLTSLDTSIYATSTRTNYTPTGATVEGNFQGIDTALSAMGGIQLQTIYVSKQGSDSMGKGTIAEPFLTIVHAVNYIVANYTPTYTSPYDIFVDDGSYAETGITGLTIYPNINIKGSGQNKVFITNSRPIALDAAWEGTTRSNARSTWSGVTCNTVFNIDTTGFTTVAGQIYLNDFICPSSLNWEQVSPSHGILVYLYGNTQLAQNSFTSITFDSMDIVANGPHSIGLGNSTLTLNSTHQACNFQSYGNVLIAPITITSSATYSISLSALAGNQLEFTDVSDAAGGTVTLTMDSTTWTSPFESAVTNTLVVYNNSLVNENSYQTIADASNIDWNLSYGINASVLLGGNHHFNAPSGTGQIAPGQITALNITQDATGGRVPTFDASFVFPNGVPAFNLSANGVTILLFQWTGSVMQLLSSSQSSSFVKLNTVYVSVDGVDSTYSGTINYPFKTIQAAQNYIVSLGTATNTNQFNIFIDAGTYLESGLKVYPNINWIGSGKNVTIIDAASPTSLALDASWNGATGNFGMENLSLTSNQVPLLDTTSVASTTMTLLLSSVNWASAYALKANTANALTALIQNSELGIASAANSVIDSVTNLNTNGSNLITGNNVEIHSSVGALQANITGDTGTYQWEFISGAAHSISGTFSAGTVMTYTTNRTAGGAINLNMDGTTWNQPDSVTGAAPVIGQLLFTRNFTEQQLTDASSIVWNTDFGINATVSLTASGHTVATPSGNTLAQGLSYTLEVQQDNIGGRTLNWSSKFIFPGNTSPIPNSLPYSSTLFQFVYDRNGNWVCQSSVSDSPNWDAYAGLNNINGVFSLVTNFNLGGGNLCPNIKPIPSTSNYLCVIQDATTAIYAFVISFDNAGYPIIPDATTWTTISSTLVQSSGSPRFCVMTDGLNAIVSYRATRSSINCENLSPLAISGTTLTLGTEIQVRATETSASCGPVVELDTTNFGLILRTSASDILYAYQMSVSGSTITTGSSPLTIETGNGNNLDAKMLAVDSTHAGMLWLSTITGSTDLYVSKLTFNGISSTPSISTIASPLAGTGVVTASFGTNLALIAKNGDSTKWICAWKASSAMTVQAVTNAGPPVASGTPYVTDAELTGAGGGNFAIAMPTANRIIGYGASSSSFNYCAGWIMNIDTSNNVTNVKKLWLNIQANSNSVAAATLSNGQVLLTWSDTAYGSLNRFLVMRP